MTQVITFLGPEIEATAYGVGQWYAQAGQKVLLLVPTPGIRFKTLIQQDLGPQPTSLGPNLAAVELQSIQLLSGAWEELRKFVRDYLPSEVLGGDVYPGELMVLPGMDTILTLNAIRQYYLSGDYDVLIYVGTDPTTTLRFIGLPHTVAWYYRRFGNILEEMDPVKIANAIGGPVATALLAANFDTQKISTALQQGKTWVDRGLAAVQDPQQIQVHLIAEPSPAAIQESLWLWGASQQVQVPIGRVLVPVAPGTDITEVTTAFAPLAVSPLHLNPEGTIEVASLPNLQEFPQAPFCQDIDATNRLVKVFLPGLTKQQVKLTQFNGELTIEAANQRRHIQLPPELQNQAVTGGKFEAPYLLITF